MNVFRRAVPLQLEGNLAQCKRQAHNAPLGHMGWKKNPPDTSGGLRGSKSVNLILNFAFVFAGTNKFEIGFDRSAFAAGRRLAYLGGSLLIRIETEFEFSST